MDTRKKIHFILNPISGRGKNKLNKKLVRGIFPKQEYDLVLKTSKQKKEAKTLATESVKEGVDVIVACGGDGTINEVATALVDTPIELGILRFGSGNGLASNLNIPKKLKHALLVIKHQHTTKIDVGVINHYYFFSNTSIGFGAELIHHYSKTTRRQFGSYFLAFLNAFVKRRGASEVSISFDNQSETITPFILFISNSNEMGYNISLTPEASLKDGKLDLVYIKDVSLWKKIALARLMLLKQLTSSQLAHYHTTQALEISSIATSSFLVQIDGESRRLNATTLTVAVKPKALSVIVPKG